MRAGMRGALAQRKKKKAMGETHMNSIMPEGMEEEEHQGVMQQLKEGLFTKNPKLYGTLLYLVFCAAFWFVLTSTQGGSQSYELVQNIRGSLGDYMDVSDAASWFDFMEGTFPGVVFPVKYYNGDGYESEHLGNVADNFMLVGAVGIRQVRSKNNTCGLASKDKIFSMVKNCFGEYSKKTEDREPYGPTVEPGTTRMFTWATAEDLGCRVGCSTAGNLGITYQGSGFFEKLPSNRSAETYAAGG